MKGNVTEYARGKIPVKRMLAVAIAVLAMLASQASATVSIDYVTVGDVGNPSDPLTGNVFGSVGYTYGIGTYEVTLNQYTEFLNAVAAIDDPNNLYEPLMGNTTTSNVWGISQTPVMGGGYSYSVIGGGNRPVAFMSWLNAARFANWMANGQPIGIQAGNTTEDGAYKLTLAIAGTSYSRNATNPNTGLAPTWALPTENEWYKAAYYDPTPGAGGASGDNYWLYATGSNATPGNTIGIGGNEANYYVKYVGYATTQDTAYVHGQDYLTDVGSIGVASYYGTFDQAGNVSEWTETKRNATELALRGGDWYSGSSGTLPVIALRSTALDSDLPSNSLGGDNGFRLVYLGPLSPIPEPSAVMLTILGSGVLMFRRRRTNRA